MGSFSCECKSGYVDTENCINHVGSYQWLCKPGYEGENCTNINECNLSDVCGDNSVCNDTDGSFTCICKDGYVESSLGCIDINKCIAKPCDDNAKCTHSDGDFTCENAGFTGDGFTCENINECDDSFTNNCHSDAFCKDIIGSFSCQFKRVSEVVVLVINAHVKMAMTEQTVLISMNV